MEESSLLGSKAPSDDSAMEIQAMVDSKGGNLLTDNKKSLESPD